MAKAKAKVKKTKSDVGKFVLMTSECGKIDQLRGANEYPTREAAEKDANIIAKEASQYGDPLDTMYILQVVAIGKPAGIEWK